MSFIQDSSILNAAVIQTKHSSAIIKPKTPHNLQQQPSAKKPSVDKLGNRSRRQIGALSPDDVLILLNTSIDYNYAMENYNATDMGNDVSEKNFFMMVNTDTVKSEPSRYTLTDNNYKMITSMLGLYARRILLTCL